MRRLQFIPIILAAITVVAARADFVPVRSAEPGAVCAPIADTRLADSPAAVGVERLGDAPWLDGALPSPLSSTHLPAPEAPSREAHALELPAAPDSAVLCLSALAGLGVWHLGRSARKLDFGVVPEWYHAAGPTQVGHATPLDLEFSLSAMPICRFEAPVAAGDEPPAPKWLRHEPIARLHSQYTLLIADPRGPPTVA